MLPHYIIDGYNLLHAIPTLKKLLSHDAFQAREQLVQFVSRLTFRRKFRCTIVFDGAQPSSPHPSSTRSPVHIVFSHPNSADIKIRSMIEASKNRTQLVVISSDHEILKFAKVCSCATFTSRSFSNLLFEDEDRGEQKDQTTLSKSQVEEWMKIFGEKK